VYRQASTLFSCEATQETAHVRSCGKVSHFTINLIEDVIPRSQTKPTKQTRTNKQKPSNTNQTKTNKTKTNKTKLNNTNQIKTNQTTTNQPISKPTKPNQPKFFWVFKGFLGFSRSFKVFQWFSRFFMVF
jgi:hypothetical protein